MFIPDVINTLLMGLIFMVVIVTIIRPFILNLVGDPMSNSEIQKAAIDAVEREMMRKAELFEAQRSEKIKYQMLLLEKPEKPKPKPVVEPEPEPMPEPVVEHTPEPVVEVAPEPVVEVEIAPEEPVSEPPVEEVVEEVSAETESEPEPVVAEVSDADSEPEQELPEGEIEIREGESLAEIKERIRKEQQKAKKPTIPPELLNSANSYEDKVGVVRMVVQSDQSRVASVIRSMIQVK
ncbi:MAG: Flagellar M-ring protein [Pseudomonadota bacterium]|jgi:hypothetical protein